MARKASEPIKGVHAGGAAWLQVHASIAAHALQLLSARGFGSFTVDNLAAASGINRRTIYRHYPTRAELAVAAIRQMPMYDPAWSSATGSPRERLRAATRTVSVHPVLLPGLLATAVTHAEDAPELLEAVTDYVLRPRAAFINRLLQEGKDVGWIRPEATEWEVSALINGLLFEEALQLVAFPNRAERADALTDAIWRQVARDPEGDGTPGSRD
jgi:AcrR family transcriptional regulator